MSDTSSSNVGAIVGPDGRAEGVFPGGLKIPLDDTTAPALAQTVRWERRSNAAVVAKVQGVVNGDFSELGLWATRAGDPNSYALLKGDVSGAIARTRAVARVGAQVQLRDLLNSAGASDWLQLASAGNGAPETLALDLGTGVVHFTGSAPNEGASVTVAHALGRVPRFAVAFGVSTTDPGDLFWNISSPGVLAWNASTITFAAQLNNDAQTPGDWRFVWAAIG